MRASCANIGHGGRMGRVHGPMWLCFASKAKSKRERDNEVRGVMLFMRWLVWSVGMALCWVVQAQPLAGLPPPCACPPFPWVGPRPRCASLSRWRATYRAWVDACGVCLSGQPRQSAGRLAARGHRIGFSGAAAPYAELVGTGPQQLPPSAIRPLARFKEADGQEFLPLCAGGFFPMTRWCSNKPGA